VNNETIKNLKNDKVIILNKVSWRLNFLIIRLRGC
jgi:hypothetical protein